MALQLALLVLNHLSHSCPSPRQLISEGLVVLPRHGEVVSCVRLHDREPPARQQPGLKEPLRKTIFVSQGALQLGMDTSVQSRMME